MRSVLLIVLLLAPGCAERYAPGLISEGDRAWPLADEGRATDVRASITGHSAAGLGRISGEAVPAGNIDLPMPTTARDAVLGDLGRGTRVASVYGSTIFGDQGKGEMHLLHAGVGYHFLDYQSISLDVFGGYVRSGIDDDGAAAGFDVVYRNHFYRADDDDWTTFVEGGLGLQQASTNFAGRRHFNFRTRVGVGASFEVREDVRAFVGVSYQHISDAGIKGGGGGFDGPMLTAGVMFPL